MSLQNLELAALKFRESWDAVRSAPVSRISIHKSHPPAFLPKEVCIETID